MNDKPPRIIHNGDIASLLIAIPDGHRHLRLALTMEDGETLVLPEAAVAAIVRAYTAVKTHPARRAAKMLSVTPEGLKPGYAERQLIEQDADDAEVIAELTRLLPPS